MDEMEGLPEKWKLIHCTATSGIPDYPMSKWRDADILNLLNGIAEQAKRVTQLEEANNRLIQWMMSNGHNSSLAALIEPS